MSNETRGSNGNGDGSDGAGADADESEPAGRRSRFGEIASRIGSSDAERDGNGESDPESVEPDASDDTGESTPADRSVESGRESTDEKPSDDDIESWNWLGGGETDTADDTSEPTRTGSIDPDVGSDDHGTDTTGGEPAADRPEEPDRLEQRAKGGTHGDTDEDRGQDAATGRSSTTTTATEANEKSSARSSEASGKSGRLWNRNDTGDRASSDRGAATRSDRSVQPKPDDTPSEDPFSQDSGETDGYQHPDGFDLAPGDSALIQCGSRDERKHAACVHTLGTTSGSPDRHVLLIRYRRMDEGRLERIAEQARHTKLIAIGYAQPVPDAVDDAVDVVKINNPNDITRLGIVVSGTVSDWADEPGETVVCYDSLNVLFEYKDVKSTFRFLHVFLGTLQESDAISHFHVDPLAGDPQAINTLKPLFDEVVSVDSTGVHLE